MDDEEQSRLAAIENRLKSVEKKLDILLRKKRPINKLDSPKSSKSSDYYISSVKDFEIGKDEENTELITNWIENISSNYAKDYVDKMTSVWVVLNKNKKLKDRLLKIQGEKSSYAYYFNEYDLPTRDLQLIKSILEKLDLAYNLDKKRGAK